MRSVQELGNKWAKIAERLPGRTEHAIRNRFARLQSLALRGNPITLSSGHRPRPAHRHPARARHRLSSDWARVFRVLSGACVCV